MLQRKNTHEKPPLGQLLVEASLISENQLEEALREHLSTGELLGQTLVRLKFISPLDLNKFVKI
jgi:hypothetical protein